MKKLSKNQISLIGVVEDLISSNFFNSILYQERIPFATDDVNLGKWKFNDSVKDFYINVPVQRNISFAEKETLLALGIELGLNIQPRDNLSIHTSEEEFFNFFLFIIRKSKNFEFKKNIRIFY